MVGVALIHVRRSLVRYDQDRASPERRLKNCSACAELTFSVPLLTVAWLVFQRGEPVSLTAPVVAAFV